MYSANLPPQGKCKPPPPPSAVGQRLGRAVAVRWQVPPGPPPPAPWHRAQAHQSTSLSPLSGLAACLLSLTQDTIFNVSGFGRVQHSPAPRGVQDHHPPAAPAPQKRHAPLGTMELPWKLCAAASAHTETPFCLQEGFN